MIVKFEVMLVKFELMLMIIQIIETKNEQFNFVGNENPF